MNPRLALALFAAGGIALPFIAQALGEGYYIALATRILAYTIAASSLNLILGYGGMVSFGHAAFLGLGGYVVAVSGLFGLQSALVAFPAAFAAAAVVALAIGAVSLRTGGVYFIMITLAFAQMLYYVFVSLRVIGGDDGLPLPQRSALPGATLADPLALYFTALVMAVGVLLLLHRLADSPFGAALAAIRENEIRAAALGFPVYRIKLAAFALGGALCSLAGALLVNLNGFASPAMFSWYESGILMIMVILGGPGRLWSGLFGAALVLGIEHAVSGFTIHWKVALAAAILAVVFWPRAALKRA